MTASRSFQKRMEKAADPGSNPGRSTIVAEETALRLSIHPPLVFVGRLRDSNASIASLKAFSAIFERFKPISLAFLITSLSIVKLTLFCFPIDTYLYVLVWARLTKPCEWARNIWVGILSSYMHALHKYLQWTHS